MISGWRRPQHIAAVDRGVTKWCVYRDPKPDDIAQGTLGDCW